MSTFPSPLSSRPTSPSSSPELTRQRRNSLTMGSPEPPRAAPQGSFLPNCEELLRQLKKKFGNVPAEGRDVVNALSIYQQARILSDRQKALDELQTKIVDFCDVAGCQAVGDAIFDRSEEERKRLKKCSPKVSKVAAMVADYTAEWSAIKITDIPTGRPGVYTFTKDNPHTEADSRLAQARVAKKMGVDTNTQSLPEYWIHVGALVRKREPENRFGRCHSCAAAVIHCLIMDPRFDDCMIEHVGSKEHDHHFVLIGRPNANGINDKGLGDQYSWQDCAVIDVWDGNLPSKENDGIHQYVSDALACGYTKGTMKLFAAFTPQDRERHCALAESLLADNKFVPKPVELAERVGRADGTQEVQGVKYRKEGQKWVQDVSAPASAQPPDAAPE